jgi:predicted dehydrogenase
MSDTFRWGIMGTGNIASKFATDVRLSPACQVVAVGSRAPDKARRFAQQFGIPLAFGSYRELAESDEIDAVYVAVPNPVHHFAALLAIEAGKAVLVEKPFTIDLDEAQALVGAAREGRVFLMEGMWTRCLPHMRRIREILAEGRLGEIRLVTAEHGIWFRKDAAHRMYSPALAGGALLDLGVYVLSLASMVLGPPEQVTARSSFAFTGVDAQTEILLGYPGGVQAVLATSMEAQMGNRAAIVGTQARLEIDGTWYRPTSFTVTDRTGEAERFDYPDAGNGLRHEADEVARCVRAGRLESPVMTWDETLQVMTTMDEVRRAIGLVFPREHQQSAKEAL